MAYSVEKLAEEAARLAPAEFTDFCRRLIHERRKRGLPDDDELVREDDLRLSQEIMAEDWDGVPDDWELDACRSREVKS